MKSEPVSWILNNYTTTSAPKLTKSAICSYAPYRMKLEIHSSQKQNPNRLARAIKISLLRIQELRAAASAVALVLYHKYTNERGNTSRNQ